MPRVTRRRFADALFALAGASVILSALLVAAGVRSHWTRDWIDLGGRGRSYLTSEGGGVALWIDHAAGVSGYRRNSAPVTASPRYLDIELGRTPSAGLARRLKFGYDRSGYSPAAAASLPFTPPTPGAAYWPRRTLVVAPYWSLALPPAVLAIALWLVARRLFRRTLAAEGRCPSCGYDLRASPDRCPECGAIPPTRPAVA